MYYNLKISDINFKNKNMKQKTILKKIVNYILNNAYYSNLEFSINYSILDNSAYIKLEQQSVLYAFELKKDLKKDLKIELEILKIERTNKPIKDCDLHKINFDI